MIEVLWASGLGYDIVIEGGATIEVLKSEQEGGPLLARAFESLADAEPMLYKEFQAGTSAAQIALSLAFNRREWRTSTDSPWPHRRTVSTRGGVRG
ncbi:MAG: hypothetical protein KGR26_16710 [Cyanobacteria bacterium REEB65]|nr:hypothetical protein [Cyanobacteria bacterium REEB65]